MIEFKEITLNDRAWINRLLLAESSRSTDFCFGTLYCWTRSYPLLAAEYKNRLLIRAVNSENTFYFPGGSGELKPAINALLGQSKKLRLCCLTEENRRQLEEDYPDRFVFEGNRELDEYIYRADKLSTNSGRSLHDKRNRCNQFAAAHSWEFVPLVRELIPACSEMLAKWTADYIAHPDESLSGEYSAIRRAFDAYETLELDGGVLFADGCVTGFSIGEMANRDTFVIHFEKAYPDMPGAYSMVCREMTRLMMKKYPSLLYMNREEDMGLDSLRYSKLSYHPEYLLKKYTATWKEDDYGTTGI